MAILIISLSSWPIRAVLQLANGRRTAVRNLAEGLNDVELEPYVSIDKHGVEIGNSAKWLSDVGGMTVWTPGVETYKDSAGREWQQSQMLAFVIRRVLLAAQSMGNEDIELVYLIVPPALSLASRSDYTAAGVLGGGRAVELRDNSKTLTQSLSIGQRHLLIHFDMSSLRLSLSRKGANNVEEELSIDLSDRWSGTHLRNRLLTEKLSSSNSGLTTLESTLDSFLRSESEKYGFYGLNSSRDGAPIPLYIQGGYLEGVAAQIAEQIKARLATPGTRAPNLTSIAVQGRMAALIGKQIAATFPSSLVTVDSGAVLALEQFETTRIGETRNRRRHKVDSQILSYDLAMSPSEKSNPANSFESSDWLTPGLDAGATIPANFVSDIFAAKKFGDRVWIHAVSPGQSKSFSIACFEIPPLYRERSVSRLRVSVLAASGDLILLEAEFGTGRKPDRRLYDAASGKQIVISSEFGRLWDSIGIPSAKR